MLLPVALVEHNGKVSVDGRTSQYQCAICRWCSCRGVQELEALIENLYKTSTSEEKTKVNKLTRYLDGTE